MIIRYRFAPGARIEVRDGTQVEFHSPPHVGPKHPLIAEAWVVRLLEFFGGTLLGDETARSLDTSSAPAAVTDLLSELLRFGIVLRVHPLRQERPAPERTAGFLIFALGDSRYGRRAYNAALSIKKNCPACKVAVCHQGEALSGLSPACLSVFDVLIECQPGVAHLEGRFAPLWAKLHADLLSPFEHTVVVDADAVFFPGADVAGELERYRDFDFAPACSFTHLPGRIGPEDRIMGWATVQESVARFQLSRPLTQTHLFYFAMNRTAATNRLFQAAREAYRELTLRPLSSMQTWYLGSVSAELAMSIATAKCEFSLYSETHMPLLNNHMNYSDDLQAYYLGFNFCAAPPDVAWEARYDAIVRAITPPEVEPFVWKRTADKA